MMIKKLTAVLVAVLFCLSLSITALAIETDGICGNYEWEGSTVFVLDEQKHFNNGVKSAVVKMIDSKVESCVYFAFLIEFEKSGYIGDGRIRLRLNNSSSLMINLDEGITDDGGFDAEAATEYDELSFVSATEAAVYYRDSLSSSDVFKINLIDLNGKESATFEISLPDDAEDSEDEDTQNVSDEGNGGKTARSKTTKEKTTKVKTTKVRTTKIKSSRKSKTTKAFNFKKVDKNKKSAEEIKDYDDGIEYVDSDDTYSGEAENITVSVSDGRQNLKYIYIAVGTVCAMAIAGAAVLAAMKANDAKDKKDDK